jgi:hypothetical protein
MNKIYFNVGDTNFIALVNKDTYNSFYFNWPMGEVQAIKVVYI